VDNLGFVAAGYLLTALSLAGYAAHLRLRARRALRRTEASRR
jgi:hypothetical protein